jgi:hypothetical protein
MNSHFKFLTAALLFSGISVAASDYDHCRPDHKMMDRVEATLDDVEAAILYLLIDKLPDKYTNSCSFDIKGRTKKAIVKHFLNRFLFNNSLDVVADLPNAGVVSVITTDQALEVGLVVFNDVVDKKAGSIILADAGRTFLREKVVAALVWLLGQTNVEALLPDSLTDSVVYSEARNEVARHFVDKGIDRVL